MLLPSDKHAWGVPSMYGEYQACAQEGFGGQPCLTDVFDERLAERDVVVWMLVVRTLAGRHVHPGPRVDPRVRWQGAGGCAGVELGQRGAACSRPYHLTTVPPQIVPPYHRTPSTPPIAPPITHPPTCVGVELGQRGHVLRVVRNRLEEELPGPAVCERE